MSSETTTTQQNWGIRSPSYVLERQTQRVEFQIDNETISKMISKVMKDDLVKELKEKIKELEKNDDEISISDSAAEEVIRDRLKHLKEKNIREVDVIDIHFMTKLPVQQIGKIMPKLEKEGVVREDDGE